MTGVAPPPGDEPSNRWPWVALAAGVLVIVLAVVFFLFNRSNNVNINAEGSPTPSQLAAAASPSPPATIVPPTLPAAASPLASPAPSPTAQPSPTVEPSPSPLPPTPTVAQPVAAASPVAGASPAPGQAAPPTPVGQPTVPAQPAPPAQASPAATPFSGQVSAGGGLGNTRADIDAAYGSPTGETPNHLVVFRSNTFEYHVLFVPDLNGRAAVIAQLPQNGQPVTLEQAQAEAHRLLPRDAEPPNPTPEGNPQFVVERYTSQTLAQALPPEAFSAEGGQPGQFMIVYARDAQNRITRWVIGAGNDASGLLQQTD